MCGPYSLFYEKISDIDKKDILLLNAYIYFIILFYLIYIKDVWST